MKRHRINNVNSSIFSAGTLNNSQSKNKIFINHALTKYTQALFMQAKKLKFEKNYKFIWLNEDKILMRKTDGSEVLAVRCFEDLSRIK